ncbi:MAG TPA: gamma-glutamyl-gamma-aminobutyrate hydrolase family protein [Verrucomicrobiae bacterium]|nr:gamma-glutamyl-gamma-aminobutyrate hydrolase family protein [Verrucomicrobiae bacterium]
MNILLVDNGTAYINELKDWFTPELVTVRNFNELTDEDSETYNFIVLSGGHRLNVNDHEKEYAKELKIIRESSKPMLGICLGFELIAFGFGSKLSKLDKIKKGLMEIQITGNDRITDGIRSLTVFESHRWAIKELGSDLIPLAKSKDCIEIIKHKEKKIYGFQFHPEIIVSKIEGQRLFGNLMSEISM